MKPRGCSLSNLSKRLKSYLTCRCQLDTQACAAQCDMPVGIQEGNPLMGFDQPPSAGLGRPESRLRCGRSAGRNSDTALLASAP